MYVCVFSIVSSKNMKYDISENMSRDARSHFDRDNVTIEYEQPSHVMSKCTTYVIDTWW